MADGSVRIDITADDSDIKKKLDGVEDAAEDTASGLDKMGDSAEGAGKGLGAVDVAAGSLAADGLSALIGGIKDTITELIALADETREYREDMAKLDSAFTTNGHSLETANSVYKDFYAILGESDRSIEAANHLATLTKNEEDLAKWGTIAAGVTARFGDSLPIEGLTEAANETAKVGAVTGPLADALNWAGISEDAFNEKLAACNTEQERAALITSTLNTEYAAAAEEYNKLTASTQEARLATMRMEEAQAAIGETIEPLTTAWQNMKAQAFEAMLPVIQKIVGAFNAISQWMADNPGKAEIVKAVIIALAAALGVLAVALGIAGLIQLVTAAMASFGAVMGIVTSPITLIIAAIAALVAAFLYLWNNCDAFREFWLNLWAKIVEIVTPIWERIKAIFASAWAYIKQTWDKVQPYFVQIWEAIKKVFSVVKDVLGAYFSSAWEVIKLVWSAVTGYFRQIWETIKGIFSVVKNVLSGNFSEAWEGIKKIFSGWKAYFSGLFDQLIGVFSGIKDKFKEVGGNIVDGIWEGIKAGWDWLKEKAKSLANMLFGAAQEELDSHSPSRKFAWLGETAPQGLGVGWEKGMPVVEKQMIGDIEELTARVQSTVNAENARFGYSAGVADNGFSELTRAVGIQTAGINSLAHEYRSGAGSSRPIILTLNGRELGRAVVDTGSAETTRTGVKLVTGGAT